MSLTIADIANQIKNANDLGRRNLEHHGIHLDDTVSTYDIMRAIEEIEGGRMLPIAYADGGVGRILLCTYLNEIISQAKNVNSTVEATVAIV